MQPVSDISPNSTIMLGKVKIDRVGFLAPMSGITDAPFRNIAAKFGAGLVVSEMIASQALATGQNIMVQRMQVQSGLPNVMQLAGRETKWMAEGARVAEGAGADVIDINMGCPAKRVTTGYSGSALMRDLDHALRLIDATVGATSRPVTLKMRLGWDSDSMNAADLAVRAQEAGVAMITVHGRTRNQFYKGKANWAEIARVKQAIDIPLVANGDLMRLDDAKQMRETTGADAVMIGRGCYGRPWFAGQVSDCLAGVPVRAEPDGPTLVALILEQFEAMMSLYGAYVGLRAMRKHLGWYLDQLVLEPADMAKIRKEMLTCGDADVLRAEIKAVFDSVPLRKSDWTEAA